MLAVSPFRDENHHHQHHHHQQGGEVSTTLSSLESNYAIDTQELPDFADANLLIDSIDFDDLFAGIDDGDMLPDLEMDPEILAEFSVSSPGRGGNNQESSERTMMTMDASVSAENKIGNNRKEEEDKVSASASASASGSSLSKEEEIVSKREEPVKTSAKDHGDKLGSSRSSSHSKINNHGKRKVKVDWTPELHRRFVQAVEQLGVDKAVPSRILELMGIDCLTRHNIASHLQKYRSHRKHLLAREAEAASWSQRRHMYGGAAAGGGKRDMNHWIAPPTIGFPPMTPPPPPPMHPHLQPRFRPLHVWGHPTMDQCLMHMWHKSSPPPPPAQAHSVPVLPSWAGQPAARPPPPHWHQQQVPNGLATPGTPCFPQPLATTRFAAPPVPGIPPHHPAMYKVEPQPGVGVLTAQSGPHLLIDSLPSKESIDAAIGDVLSKPWLPLPLGLKAPSVDGVIGELQRQGVSKIPPSSA